MRKAIFVDEGRTHLLRLSHQYAFADEGPALRSSFVSTESRGDGCHTEANAYCSSIHDEIPEPRMTLRNRPLGKLDRTTEYH
jgi:hypothetical protein